MGREGSISSGMVCSRGASLLLRSTFFNPLTELYLFLLSPWFTSIFPLCPSLLTMSLSLTAFIGFIFFTFSCSSVWIYSCLCEWTLAVAGSYNPSFPIYRSDLFCVFTFEETLIMDEILVDLVIELFSSIDLFVFGLGCLLLFPELMLLGLRWGIFSFWTSLTFFVMSTGFNTF